jgi:hypothetical protein
LPGMTKSLDVPERLFIEPASLEKVAICTIRTLPIPR